MKYPFSDTLPYFITQISTSMLEIVSKRFDQCGMSIPMYRALVTLRGGQVLTLSELSKIISVDQSTLSRQVGAMVRHGLVTRRRSDDNGRIVLIEITPDGRRTVEGLLPFVQDLEKAALDSMQPDEIQNLKQSLKRLEENLAAFRDEANSIPGR